MPEQRMKKCPLCKGEGKIIDGLTSQEYQVLKRIAEGKSIKEIAYEMEISSRTAECHRYNAMKKLDLHSIVEVVHYAVATGMVYIPQNDTPRIHDNS